MPKKSVSVKKAPTSRQTPKAPSRLMQFLAGRTAMAAVFMLIFVAIGASTLYIVSAATTSYSLWSNAIPRTLAVSDSASTELGLKFRSTAAGYVTGVRFYKSAQNTGVHVGTLWDSQGTLLASVTFAGESSSGWQTATFAKPVSIAAGVPYLISYHAPKGHYSLNTSYLSRSAYHNKKLVALRSTAGHPNGVHLASASSTFPTQSGTGANYWVDVVFNTKLVNSKPAPAAPAGLTAAVQANNTIVLHWQASIAANPVSQYAVYRDGSKLATSITGLTYTDDTAQAGATYHYQVQATDNTGVASALSALAAATVPSAPSTGGGTSSGGGNTGGGTSGGSTGTGTGSTATGATTCPLPKYPTPSCTGVPAGTAFTKTVSGDYTVTAAGMVVDGWHITGSMEIKAANVIIRNTQVDGAITNDGIAGSSFNVHDSSVGSSGCALGGQPSLNGHDILAERVYLHGQQDGIDMGGNNITVSDSFIQPCYLPPGVVSGDGYHSDGLQDQCSTTCSNLTLIHNTFDARAIYKGTPTGNSALNLGSNADGLHLRTVTLKGNLLMGGGYATDLHWDGGASWVITGNSWARGTWAYEPISTEGTCGQQTWSSDTANKIDNRIVAIDSSYNVTAIVSAQGCVN